MNAVLIEDEQKNLQILKTLLSQYCQDINILGSAGEVNEAIALINKTKPQLVFFDIEINNGSAFDVLERVHYSSFESIFITAYDSYAIKAFKVNAIDYLLKPINIDELIEAVEKSKQKLQKVQFTEQLNQLLQTVKQPEINKLTVPSITGFEVVIITEILYLEAKNNYTEIVLVGNRKLMTSKTLKEYEEILNNNMFFRVHYSCIVNMDRIKKYVRARGGHIIMENGLTIEVATRRRNEFLERFKR